MDTRSKFSQLAAALLANLGSITDPLALFQAQNAAMAGAGKPLAARAFRGPTVERRSRIAFSRCDLRPPAYDAYSPKRKRKDRWAHNPAGTKLARRAAEHRIGLARPI